MMHEFLMSLGNYVYGYKNPETNEWDYIGKGKYNRCLIHVNEKLLNIDDLYIIAQNLEKFDEREDSSQFALESFLIFHFNPNLNKVEGRYKECFVMAKFSELFDDYKSSKFDNFESFPDWYLNNYSKFKNRVNVLTLKSDNIYLESKTRESIQMMVSVDNESNPTFVRFAVWQKGDKFDERLNQLYAFLESNNISRDKVQRAGDRAIYEVPVSDIEQAIALFDDFMG